VGTFNTAVLGRKAIDLPRRVPASAPSESQQKAAEKVGLALQKARGEPGVAHLVLSLGSFLPIWGYAILEPFLYG